MDSNNRIAVIGGGAFGILSALRLSQNPDNQITIFESTDRLGGISASERYKNQSLDYTTKFIPCNQFGEPGIPRSLALMLNTKGALLDDIGEYHFIAGGKEKMLPPALKGFSKLQLLREAVNVFQYFTKADKFASFTELERVSGFQRDRTMDELGDRLGFSSFTRLIEYFSMVFGNSTRGADSLAVVTSRNAYTTYNYLSGILLKNGLLSAATSLIDRQNLLNRGAAIPHKFFMLTTGYDKFLQSLVQDRPNIKVHLDQTIVELDKNESEASRTYTLINAHQDVFGEFDEVVLALPMRQLKKFKYAYIQDLVREIRSDGHNYVLTTFANVESHATMYLPKGIYLDYGNPHKIGTAEAKKDGSFYGAFKHFHADTMFQGLTMVNDIDHNDIDESFIHAKWCQCMKELHFAVDPKNVKPYSWKIVKWNTPFAQVGDFARFERLNSEQGKEGIWFGGEMMSGPGVPVILKYIESMFGAFEFDSSQLVSQ